MNSIFAHASSIPEVNVSILAVILATIAAMAIGSVWYGPLFGKKWMKLVKLSKKDADKNWQKPMLTMLIMALVQAFILSHFVVYSGYFYPDLNNIVLGAITGFWAFVGFALPAVLGNNMFARRPNELSTIEVGNQLVTLVAMGVIIGAFL